MTTAAATAAAGSAGFGFIDALTTLAQDGVNQKDQNGNLVYHQYTPEETLDHIKNTAKSGDDAYTKFTAFETAFDNLANLGKTGDSSIDSEIASARADMHEAERHLQALFEGVSSAKASFAQSDVQDAELIMAARSRYGKQRAAKGFQAEEILKMIFVSYLGDPQRSIVRVDSNLRSLRVLLGNDLTAEPIFKFQVTPTPCRIVRRVDLGASIRKNEDCISFEATAEPRTMYGALKTKDGGKIEVPLVQFGEWSGLHEIPLYSITSYEIK